MIPQTIDLTDFKIKELPTKTYHLDGNRVYGYTDGLEAIKQAIYLALNTERYKYIIYSWNYGVELEDLFGKPIPLVLAELERVIKEALLVDTRIIKVDNFKFESQQNKVSVTFTVSTIFGDIETGKEVLI